MIDNIRADVTAVKGNYRCKVIIVSYRVAHLFSGLRRRGVFWGAISSPVLVAYRFLTEWVLQYEIPAATEIGPGIVLDHGYGIVINKNSVIGDRVRIKHGVTIGCKTNDDGTQGPSPVIGSNVDIGANACIIGDIRVGCNVKVGAGAVVIKDVPNNSIVVGNPGRIIPRVASNG